jgi:hypothetical protein
LEAIAHQFLRSPLKRGMFLNPISGLLKPIAIHARISFSMASDRPGVLLVHRSSPFYLEAASAIWDFTLRRLTAPL